MSSPQSLQAASPGRSASGSERTLGIASLLAAPPPAGVLATRPLAGYERGSDLEAFAASEREIDKLRRYPLPVVAEPDAPGRVGTR